MTQVNIKNVDVEFSSLDNGDFFMFCGALMMKIETVFTEEEKYDAVDINSPQKGTLEEFAGTERVMKVSTITASM